MWFERKKVCINGVWITEPTARQFCTIKKALDDGDGETIAKVIYDLAGEVPSGDYVSVLTAVLKLGTENPMKETKESSETAPIDWSIVLLQDADLVAAHYGMSIFEVLETFTWRQIRYIIWIVLNAKLADLRQKVILNGGKLKQELVPFRLKEDDGLGTAGMTKQEIAEYYRQRKRHDIIK